MCVLSVFSPKSSGFDESMQVSVLKNATLIFHSPLEGRWKVNYLSVGTLDSSLLWYLVCCTFDRLSPETGNCKKTLSTSKVTCTFSLHAHQKLIYDQHFLDGVRAHDEVCFLSGGMSS